MFCRNCGTKLPEGAAFCPSCATKVEVDVARTAGVGSSVGTATSGGGVASGSSVPRSARGMGELAGLGGFDAPRLVALGAWAIAGTAVFIMTGIAFLDSFQDVLDVFSSYSASEAGLGFLTFMMMGLVPIVCAANCLHGALRCFKKSALEPKSAGMCISSSITLLAWAALSAAVIEPFVSSHGADGFVELGMTFYVRWMWPAFSGTVWVVAVALAVQLPKRLGSSHASR